MGDAIPRAVEAACGTRFPEAWTEVRQRMAAWRGGAGPVRRSLLTPSGAALELTCTTVRELRATVEAAPPDASPALRASVAKDLLRREGAAVPPLLRTLAGAPGQRFGVWLGIRQRAGGAPRYKLYQEVAPGAAPAAAACLRAAVGRAVAEGIAPTLAGFPVGEEGVEVYGRVRSARPAFLHALLAAAGVAGALPRVLGALALLAARPFQEVPGPLRLGCSVQTGPTGACAVTLYAHAAELFPDTGTGLTRLLAAANALGCDLPVYRALQVGEHGSGTPFVHGLVGITARQGAEPVLSVGIAPLC